MNLSKIVSFLCVFMYFASPYRLGGHALPEIIGVFAIILQFFKNYKVIILEGYGAFMVYMLFIPATVSLITGLPGNYLISFIPINLILYSILFCFLIPNVNKEYVIRYYTILVYISVGLFIIQEISYYCVGFRPTMYLPLEMYYEGSDAASLSESRSEMNRSSSFFLEPAHFAQYILPYYCIIIYNCIKDRIVTKELFLFTAVILFLQSGCGYIGLATIFISIIFMKGLIPLRIKFILITIFIGFIVTIAIILYDNFFVVELLTRMNEITSLEVKAHGSQSGFLRIWRGYFIYNNLSPIYKFFGVGLGSIEYISKLVYIPGSRYEGSYMNGIQTLLISGGIVGTLLFFRFIRKCLDNIGKEGKIIMMCMISMFFIEHMLFTPKMFLYFLVAFAVTNISKNYHSILNSSHLCANNMISSNKHICNIK